jgi:hypothetical protein
LNANRGGIRSRQRLAERSHLGPDHDHNNASAHFPFAAATSAKDDAAEQIRAKQTRALRQDQQKQQETQRVGGHGPDDAKIPAPAAEEPASASHPDGDEVFYESEYSEYEDDDSEYQYSEVDAGLKGGIKGGMRESLSLPLLIGSGESISHPVVTGAPGRLRETKAFGQYMDSAKRPWIQQRAEQVHQTNSVFSSSSRPRIPGAVVRGADISRARLNQRQHTNRHIDATLTHASQNAKVFSRSARKNDRLQGYGSNRRSIGRAKKKKRKKKRKKKKQLMDAQSTDSLSLPSIAESPSRVVPGGDHRSMLATAERRKMWLDKSHSMTSLCVNHEDARALQLWLFERLMAIMKVYRLRSKDLFASLDRDSDGIVSCGDMQESLQVLGLHSITQKETQRVVKRISRLRPGNHSGLLNFDAFEFALRRSNTKRESMLARRQGHYVFEQNALADRISASQRTVKVLIATAATDMDATRDIRDPSGRKFWQRCFSCHTPSVPLSRLIKELKQQLWMNAVEASASRQRGGGTSLGVGANFTASMAGRRPQTSTNDKWVFRRIVALLGGDLKRKITSLQFGDLLHTFGPLDRLLENVLCGPLESKSARKKRELKTKHGGKISFSRGNTMFRKL